MVKSFAAVVLILLINTTTAFPQARGMGWGLKGGINLSGLQTENTLIVANNTKLGWQAGVFTNTTLSGWGFWAETTILTMGSQQVIVDESQRTTVGYLSFPLGLQYQTENNLRFLLGGYASIRLWAKRKSAKAGVGDIKSDIRSNIAFVDYGGWASISYTYRQLVFDLRYMQGVPNINTNSTINARATNASGQFSIAYYLK
jgi:Outer membrane protein beta-barrel domain